MNNKENITQWTEVIEPKRSLFDVNIKEIWHYRDLILLFVRRDFVSQYKQTILGPIWLFIQPLFTTVTFLFVFNKIAKISTDGINPTLFYLSGITMWNYFADCLTKTSNTFLSNAGVFGKVYFPRLVTPISIVISSLIKLSIQLLLLASVYLFFFSTGEQTFSINATIVLLPIYLLIMAVLGFGIGIILSSLTTKYRDLSYLLTFGVQLLMYATPVIYPLNSTAGRLRKIIELNPTTSIIENFRYSVFSQGEFRLEGMIYAALFSLGIVFIGILFFNQVEKSFMDTV
ncbi:MAG: ABC transporter permease [Chitinophagales bacterium]